MRALSLTDTRGQRPARNLASALAARVIRAFERRRAINELEQLDDYMLSDIGVSRADIPRVVDGSRY